MLIISFMSKLVRSSAPVQVLQYSLYREKFLLEFGLQKQICLLAKTTTIEEPPQKEK